MKTVIYISAKKCRYRPCAWLKAFSRDSNSGKRFLAVSDTQARMPYTRLLPVVAREMPLIP